MRNDPIVDEIRRTRQEHTDKFNGDLHAICEHLRRLERESGREYASYPPRRVEHVAASTSTEKAT
ncbi:MAG: hypothetical protein DWQ41_24700 [Planctomycetota bacterium]|nr:MAG: hypothetical protein DWQ41_24700 [Planctomycetota bacterium]